jgi:hypothetical protein
MKKFLLYVAIILLLTAGMAAAADEPKLEIGADYRFRYDMLKGTVHDYVSQSPGNPSVPGFKVWNNWLMLDYLALNVKADATEDLTVKAKVNMYKVWGHQTMQPVQGSFFADRAVGPFDGTVSHVPSDSLLRVDEVYATLSNIGGAPVWFSAGRKPSTGGVPTNLKRNLEKTGPEGFPGIMIDQAFDGLALGSSPQIAALPGAYAKLFYGKGFDSGFDDQTRNTLKDTDFVGLNVVPYDSNDLQINLQVQKGFHVGDQPSDTVFAPNTNQHAIDPTAPVIAPTANVGDITWWGGVIMGKVSDLNLFASVAQSRTAPSDGVNAAGAGLLWDSFHDKANHTGTAFYVGGRYDIKSIGTKIGLEYNQGSKYWVGMVPAGDDIWTSKLGTRGEVYEVYLIKELKNRPLMKNAKAFWRFGYEYYKFDYTGSNNWMGAPIKISNLDLFNPAMAQNLQPLEKASDLYMVFEVLF